MQCPHCAAVVTDPIGPCQACGRVPTDPTELADLSPVMQVLYKAAVGSQGQDYYLTQFARFDLAGKTSITWHWPACLSTLNWLAWRGMWSATLLFAALCLSLGLLVFGIGRLVFDFSAASELALLALCLGLVFVLPGLFGNAVYYRFAKRRIEAALAACATVDEACESLASQAGSNRRWFVLAATNSSLIVVVGLFAWLLTSSSAVEQASVAAPASPVPTHPVMTTPTPVLVQTDMPSTAPTPSAPTAAPTPTLPSSAAATAEFRFALQVGAFASENNARKAQAKLQAAGFKAYTEVFETRQGKRIRVRVGPFATRAEAQQAAPRIKELELPALLVKS